MDLPVPHALSATDRPVRRAARRLHWFKNTFAQQVDAISEASGVVFNVRNDRLARSFVEWLRAFEAQKPNAPSARRAYVNFASGLMLRQLIRDNPLETVSIPEGADLSNPAYFWPEGYVYVAYCLNVRSSVLEQEFDETVHLTPAFRDIRTWWSFKENAAENISSSIGFLDLFAGESPQWTFPEIFQAGAAASGRTQLSTTPVDQITDNRKKT